VPVIATTATNGMRTDPEAIQPVNFYRLWRPQI
jgi:hypothetical protein